MLRCHDWQARLQILNEQFGAGFINVIFDKLNERAYDELGDVLVFEEAEEWIVAEDYRDEIEFILDNANSDRDGTPFSNEMERDAWETLPVS